MLSIRPATVKDVPLLRSMIRELADYERELDSVEITEEQLAEDGFGENPKYRALIAEWDGQRSGHGWSQRVRPFAHCNRRNGPARQRSAAK